MKTALEIFHGILRAFAAAPSWLENVARAVLPFHFAAWDVANSSISIMVNETNEHDRNRMLDRWRSSILSQLTTVELIVSTILLHLPTLHYTYER